MKAGVLGALVGFIFVGCSVTNSIVLPNGKKGLVVDCSYSQWRECFKSAGEMCPKGYDIYERTKDEFTDSKLPITELPKRVETAADGMVIGESRPQQMILKDRYMVISCAV